MNMKTFLIIFTTLLMVPMVSTAQYLGDLSNNRYAPNSLSNPSGAGNSYRYNSPTNLHGPNSMHKRYAGNGNSPKIYDSHGKYHGNLNNNTYDPNSVANPYGKYGSKYSADSINNKYGAGSAYRKDSPNNRYGSGMLVYSP